MEYRRQSVNSLRFGGAGMRGEVGNGLTPMNVIDFVSALVCYIGEGTLVLGTDFRFSTPMIKNAAISSLLATGMNVIDAGICPAPFLHYLVKNLHANAGLLISGSHHPANWNSLIPISSSGAVFNDIQMQELLDIYHAHIYNMAPWNKVAHVSPLNDSMIDQYLDFTCAPIQTEMIAKRNLRVVMDFCNGAGSVLSEKFAKKLNIELIPLNNIPSGILPHSPEPRPRSAVQAQSLLKAIKADIAFVFNSDMSRFSVVTSSGETLSEEYTFPLIVNHFLTHFLSKGASIVTNWCTTRSLDKIVEQHGAVLHRTKVGEHHILEKMNALNAPLGGEGSGSAAFSGLSQGFDSFHASARILEAMCFNQMSSSQLADLIPRFHIIKRAIPCNAAHAYSILRAFRNEFQNALVSDEDGFYFKFCDGWIHLRASATESLIRMTVEWKTREEAEDQAMYVRGLLERLILS